MWSDPECRVVRRRYSITDACRIFCVQSFPRNIQRRSRRRGQGTRYQGRTPQHVLCCELHFLYFALISLKPQSLRSPSYPRCDLLSQALSQRRMSARFCQRLDSHAVLLVAVDRGPLRHTGRIPYWIILGTSSVIRRSSYRIRMGCTSISGSVR
jgi:hypothetical protein